MDALNELAGSYWTGSSELWVDPLGDEVTRGECKVALEPDLVRYTWTHEGETHRGVIDLRQSPATFTDSWHQPQPSVFRRLQDLAGLFQILGSYGPEGEWGWRIGLSHRTPTDELVLQMTNIAPWGEEARAVRMICRRDEG